jgi:Protein of unknown function (DUF2752)
MRAPPDHVQLQRQRDVEMLALASIVVVMAFLLQVNADGTVAFWLLPDHPLPPSCPSFMWLKVKCPGCGLTRSIVYLAHGSWLESWHIHRVGWLMAAAILFQLPYRIISLRRPSQPVLGTLFPRLFGWLLVALLIGNWLFDAIRGHL